MTEAETVDPASLPPAVCLMGPTASGKTGLALELAARLPLEIVSVDSALVYRGLDIGTAKPPPDVRRRFPHHLVDILDPAEAYSAAAFRRDALAAMDEIRGRGKVPLLTGGTMLYFRALEQGLSPLPDARPDIRRRLAERLETEGLAALHRELQACDPEAAGRIHPNDPQRILRALEVFEAAGRPMSELIAERAGAASPWRWLKFALLPADRGILHSRIAERFDAMLRSGLVDEVARLRSRGDLHARLPSMRAVGYRQAWEYLEGRLDEAGLRERGVAATRQLAKRQLTWLRAEDDLHILDMVNYDAGSVSDRIGRLLT